MFTRITRETDLMTQRSLICDMRGDPLGEVVWSDDASGFVFTPDASAERLTSGMIEEILEEIERSEVANG